MGVMPDVVTSHNSLAFKATLQLSSRRSENGARPMLPSFGDRQILRRQSLRVRGVLLASLVVECSRGMVACECICTSLCFERFDARSNMNRLYYFCEIPYIETITRAVLNRMYILQLSRNRFQNGAQSSRMTSRVMAVLDTQQRL